ncbi:hypothetical protein B0T17DRAFT_635510 [Bombardia bombarda]|uniref:Uncharacterized protein n=1 Tax=Bombardia bombarda TaxID=252184 RepID=A0AA39XA63_9PEZI|nr:hypothetical protein B0T17DRAFT_635510 [Bombardia bombarda]
MTLALKSSATETTVSRFLVSCFSMPGESGSEDLTRYLLQNCRTELLSVLLPDPGQSLLYIVNSELEAALGRRAIKQLDKNTLVLESGLPATGEIAVLTYSELTLSGDLNGPWRFKANSLLIVLEMPLASTIRFERCKADIGLLLISLPTDKCGLVVNLVAFGHEENHRLTGLQRRGCLDSIETHTLSELGPEWVESCQQLGTSRARDLPLAPHDPAYNEHVQVTALHMIHSFPGSQLHQLPFEGMEWHRTDNRHRAVKEAIRRLRLMGLVTAGQGGDVTGLITTIKGDCALQTLRRIGPNIKAGCLISSALASGDALSQGVKRLLIRAAAMLLYVLQAEIKRPVLEGEPDMFFTKTVDGGWGPATELAVQGFLWLCVSLWEQARVTTNNFAGSDSTPDRVEVADGWAQFHRWRCQRTLATIREIEKNTGLNLLELGSGLALSPQDHHELQKHLILAFVDSLCFLPKDEAMGYHIMG